jgi:polyisoprenoid-binding protein YceI
MRIAVAVLVAAGLAACDLKPPEIPVNGPPEGASAAGGPADPAFPSGPTTFYFGTNPARTNVGFESKTEITNILGGSNVVIGGAVIDWSKGTGSCELKVPTATLNSGMADRDRAMLGKTWLDAKQFPTIEFKSDQASFNKPNTWKLDGKFSLHGVTKDLSLEARLRYYPEAMAKQAQIGDGAWVAVTASFTVKLGDYGIVIPDTAVATVRPEIAVTLDLWGTTAKPDKVAEISAAPVEDEDAPIKVIRPPKVSPDGIEGARYKFGTKSQLAQMAAQSITELERVTATTKIIGGYVGIDKAKGLGKVRLAAPVSSLRTGIKARDEHMLGPEWLDAKAHPIMEFESTKAAPKGDKAWTVEGEFKLHGVSKPVSLEVAVRDIPAELMKKAHWGDKSGLGFTGTFKVKLTDHGIKIPSGAVGKVADEWTVTFDLIGLLEE